MSENQVTLQTKTLKDVFEMALHIPDYQRPYRWRAKVHVAQLLKDIEREQKNNKKEYLVGSLILHQEKDKTILNIVDGQQRLVTFTILLHSLNEKVNDKEQISLPLLCEKFPHADSKENIRNNQKYINNYLAHFDDIKKNAVKNFALNNCLFNVITVFDISEAFQLFDSQNSRGKELYAADLLKTFHLRNMEECSEEEKLLCVKRWEKAMNDKKLNPLIAENLFRIRSWIKGGNYYDFDKSKIDHFKGIGITEMLKTGKSYPYMFTLIHASLCNRFQIDEPIVNGKRFFDYIDFYLNLLDKTNFYPEMNFEKNKNTFVTGRLIDQRIESFYKNVLLYYKDKFGEDENYFRFALEIFRMSFVHILVHRSLQAGGILKHLVNNDVKIFQMLKSWYEPDIISVKNKIKIPDEKKYKSRWNIKVTVDNIETEDWNRFIEEKIKKGVTNGNK